MKKGNHSIGTFIRHVYVYCKISFAGEAILIFNIETETIYNILY